MSVDYFTCDVCNHPSDDWYGKYYAISGIEMRVCHDCIVQMIENKEIVHVEDFDTDELRELAEDYGEEGVYRFTYSGKCQQVDRLNRRACKITELVEQIEAIKE